MWPKCFVARRQHPTARLLLLHLGVAGLAGYCKHDYLFDMNDVRLPDSSPVRSFGFRLWHVKHAFVRRLEAALLPLGLTHMQYVVLRAADYLAQAGERPTQARLAEGTATDRMMVSKVLRLLEGKGLVVRPIHPSDARAHHVVLTEAGRRMVARSIPLATQAQAEFFGRLGDERMGQLSAILNELLRLEGNGIAPACLAAPGPAPGGVMSGMMSGVASGMVPDVRAGAEMGVVPSGAAQAGAPACLPACVPALVTDPA